jgi:hypothetical protein
MPVLGEAQKGIRPDPCLASVATKHRRRALGHTSGDAPGGNSEVQDQLVTHLVPEFLQQPVASGAPLQSEFNLSVDPVSPALVRLLPLAKAPKRFVGPDENAVPLVIEVRALVDELEVRKERTPLIPLRLSRLRR